MTYEIIKAAVAGEKWATEKVIAHYDSYIEELATVKEKQPDGSVKTYVNEDMKQSIILKLLEEIPNFPMETNGCIFRKNCASVPEERSAIPLQTEQSSAG